MAVVITHNKVATLPDEVGAEVNKAEWNDAHAVTGIGTFFVTEGAEDLIVAFAGGGQASATALSAAVNLHRVSTCATTANSVKLPAATAGISHYVRNDGSFDMQVFGQSTETINGIASATGIRHAKGLGAWYVCTTAGEWNTSPIDSVTFAGTQLQIGPAGAGRSYYNNSSGWNIGSGMYFGWASTTDAAAGAADALILRAAANSIRFGTTTATTTSRTEINKTVTAFTDAVAKATFTVTIPNAAQSAVLEFEILGIIGAGGAIGVNEAVATTSGKIVITRTPGVNAVAVASAAFGAAVAAVAGATTATVAAAVSAIAGAVGATNTFTLDVTITKGGGASANHIALCYGKLMNANASGITIA